MSNLPTSAASSAASDSPTSDRPSLAQITEANRTAALSAAGSRRTGSLTRLAAGAGIFGTLLAAGVMVAPQADARVLPVTTVTAHPGPITTPAGLLRCKGRGDYHFTVRVHTTTRDADGHAHAAVWIQESRKGRAILAGAAKSSTSTVTVIGCVNPSRIDGGSGPIYGIASDVVDTNTRSFQIRFGR